MRYTNEPDDSCHYIDSVLGNTDEMMDNIQEIVSKTISKNTEELETVRSINQTLRIDNRELSSRVEELEMQLSDKEQEIADLHRQLKDYESEIYRLECEIQEVSA